jgi:DNA topoisomerase-1
MAAAWPVMVESLAAGSSGSSRKTSTRALRRRTDKRATSAGAAVLLRDSLAASRAARLRYVASDEPGFTRMKKGSGFAYVGVRGSLVTDAKDLERIRKLAIPPAWKNVWICRHGNGHLQATGIDARGRKQYRYHARWREVRDDAKYHDILHFAERLPRLRKRISRDLASSELTKAKVVATVLLIMERTAIRVGNDRYTEMNGSYGLTTLLDRHAKISGGSVSFRFKGKGGKIWNTTIHDERLARIVKRCRDIPGQRLFQYIDPEGRFRGITSSDVNGYIQEATGHSFTAKEFRTWTATVSAMSLLNGYPPCRSQTDGKRQILRAVEQVAKELGNTRAICKKSYIHPTVFDSYLAGNLHGLYARCSRGTKRFPGLRAEECTVLAFFREFEQGLERLAS